MPFSSPAREYPCGDFPALFPLSSPGYLQYQVQKQPGIKLAQVLLGIFDYYNIITP